MDKLEEQIRADVKKFFKDIESQNQNDQTESLTLLLKQYSHYQKAEHIMLKHDFNEISQIANNLFKTTSLPRMVGQSTVGAEENVNMTWVEATISYLNKHNCLKRFPKFKERTSK